MQCALLKIFLKLYFLSMICLGIYIMEFKEFQRLHSDKKKYKEYITFSANIMKSFEQCVQYMLDS